MNLDASLMFISETQAFLRETRLITEFIASFFFILLGVSVLLFFHSILSRIEAVSVILGGGLIAILTLLLWRMKLNTNCRSISDVYARTVGENFQIFGSTSAEQVEA